VFPSVGRKLVCVGGHGACWGRSGCWAAPHLDGADVFELTATGRPGSPVMVVGCPFEHGASRSRLVDRSYFLTQLERRMCICRLGPQAYLLSDWRVGRIMRALGHAQRARLEGRVGWILVAEASFLQSTATVGGGFAPARQRAGRAGFARRDHPDQTTDRRPQASWGRVTHVGCL